MSGHKKRCMLKHHPQNLNAQALKKKSIMQMPCLFLIYLIMIRMSNEPHKKAYRHDGKRVNLCHLTYQHGVQANIKQKGNRQA